MNKKDFSMEAAGVFVEKMITPQEEQARPVLKPQATIAPTYTNKAQTEVRITFMLNKDMEAKLRYIAYREHIKYKVMLNDAVQGYIEEYEAANGKIQ